MAGLQVPEHVAQEREHDMQQRQHLIFIRQKIHDMRIAIFRDVFGRIAAERFLSADLGEIYDEAGKLLAGGEDVLKFFAECSLAAEGVYAMNCANSGLDALGMLKTDMEIAEILGGKKQEGEHEQPEQPAEPENAEPASNIILPAGA